MKKKVPAKAAKSAKRKVVYQIRVTLDGSEPEVWRRILMPEESTFWELHVAIQDAMGWLDCHLHEFELSSEKGERVRIGLPDVEIDDDVLPGWKVAVATHLNRPGDVVSYLYDFGDDWRHTVLLEGAFLADAKVKYPVCIGGAMACPPEDSGGVFGYGQMREAVADPEHPDHEEMREWLGENLEEGKPFDPVKFSPGKVRFTDAAKRLKLAIAK